MRLTLTLRRTANDEVDLAAQLDATATVGDLARAVALADPQGPPGSAGGQTSGVTIALQGDAVTLEPDQLVTDSPLASGMTFSIVRAAAGGVSGGSGEAAAVLRVIAGPDRGKEFPLGLGTSVIGRDRGCEVTLSDPMISRKHARVHVGSVVEVVDQGSANGVLLGGAAVARATLRSGDVVTVGDTELTVRATGALARGQQGEVGFIRSPQLHVAFAGQEVEAPPPPERVRPQRFPAVALVAPLIMGGVLYAITENVTSVLFIALSPLMLIGTAVESRLSARRDFREALAAWRSDLRGLDEQLRALLVHEAEMRRREHPSVVDLLPAARQRSSLLWSRRPDREFFAEVRLGLGSRPSRTTVELPRRNRAPFELVQELEEAFVETRTVDGVPVAAKLADGALGVAGSRSEALSSVRALVGQVVALHSPAEVAVVGALGSDSADDWRWLLWLPHVGSAFSPLSARPLATSQVAIASLVNEIDALLEERRESETHHPRVLFLVESTAAVDHNRLIAIAESGPALGVHVLWLAPQVSQLPACCATVVEFGRDGHGATAAFVREGDVASPLQADSLDARAADRLARDLAPVVDLGARAEDDSDLPRSVSQFALLGSALGERPEAVLERWLQNSSVHHGPYAPSPLPKKAGNLRAVIGQSAEGQHALDLRVDGPHALVGGTTGAGKSELLQSWILGLAADHSPDRVTFLLVDYKGGSAFADCEHLPHTVGLVTDLSPRLVRRALVSLTAELKYREELLAVHKAKDLVELESHGVVGAPPNLIIVVDEFAALKAEVPEFVDGVVNVAQRGRSLGLHLILATQRPQGVITGNLRANTNLRVALRMADEGDSVDVLGTDVAAGLDPSLRGRAVSKSGPGRLVSFQTAYTGGWTAEETPEPDVHLEELTLGAPSAWEPRTPVVATPKDREGTDIKRLVRSLQAAHVQAGLPAPRKPWLTELSETVDLRTLETRRRDDELTFALGDRPLEQSQPPVSFYPDQEGNLVVYGTGGTGKSTTLRSLAIAAGFSVRGGPCHVYGLDFGSRGLSMLEPLPHVGSIVPAGDDERVTRLLTWLRELIDERAPRYAAVSASTITEFRELAGRPEEPRILLLLDGVPAFRQAFESDRSRYVDLLTSIASDGRPVGVHVVLSSDQRSGLHTALAAAVQRRIVLRMASTDDYGLLGVPADMLTLESPSGRAVDAGTELQIATLGGATDAGRQATEVKKLAQALRGAGVGEAPPIRSLPRLVGFDALPRRRPGQLLVGLDSASLDSIGTEPRACFLVTGPPASGRSAALRLLLRSLHESGRPAELHYLGPRRSALAGWSGWSSRAHTPEEAVARAQELTAAVPGRPEGSPLVVVVVESAGDFVQTPADMALAALARVCIAEEQWFLAEGEVSTVRTSAGFLGVVKSSRRGLTLQPDAETGIAMFNTALPRFNRADFGPGRGFLVGAGSSSLVQVAWTEGVGG